MVFHRPLNGQRQVIVTFAFAIAEGLAPLIVREIWRIIKEINRRDRHQHADSGSQLPGGAMEKGRSALAGESAALSQPEGALKQYLGV
jgi:branched-chain amino acid transport system ATP-binding protein